MQLVDTGQARPFGLKLFHFAGDKLGLGKLVELEAQVLNAFTAIAHVTLQAAKACALLRVKLRGLVHLANEILIASKGIENATVGLGVD